MKFGYRLNNKVGEVEIDTRLPQRGLTEIASQLVADGFIRRDWYRAARFEGRVKIEGKLYPAISQGGLLVVAGEVPPKTVILRF